jgi:hypothetical protein
VALPIFAVTLFVSAFLLFLVQPMIGKMVLPSLGGTPQVWNTCMMFFQTALLVGYAYSHTVSNKLSLRKQLLVHGLLLLVPVAILLPWGPFGLITTWDPPAGGNPIFSTLWILTLAVGLPFVVVSTTAPLLQRWFAYTGHPAAKDPYFLYGASNLGSMLSLLLYPVLVEPVFSLRATDAEGHVIFRLTSQAWFWAILYIALIGLVMACVYLVLKAPPSAQLAGAANAPEPPPAEYPEAAAPPPSQQVTASPPRPAPQTTGIRKGSKQRGRHSQRPAAARSAPAAAPAVAAPAPAAARPYELTMGRRLRWIALAAVPSSLMLGVITYISTDISAIPFFWVIPLALYLLSFILVFMRWPFPWTGQAHTLMAILQPIMLLALAYILLTHAVNPITRSISLSVLTFMITALVCHGELARERPPTRYLTEFFLCMSIGGALGGIFNGLLAPILFSGPWEFPIALVLAGLVRPDTHQLRPLDRPVAVVAGAVVGVLVGFFVATFLFSTLMMIVVISFLGAGLGALFGTTYQPGQRPEGWTDSFIAFLFPGLADWLGDKGDELARGRTGSAEGTAEGQQPLRRADLPPRGYLLHIGLDILLPVLVFFFALILVFGGNSKSWGWTNFEGEVRDILRNNPLFWLGREVLGMEPRTAVSFANGLFKVLVYGLPMCCCFMFYARPLRFGLALGAILLANGMYEVSKETETWDQYEWGWVRNSVLYRGRSYFGILRVHEDARMDTDKKTIFQSNTYLMHGTTHHGLNYQIPKDWRRLATTYYHRYGPVGVIMSQLDWFPPPRPSKVGADKREWALKNWNTYWADARLPASMFLSFASPMPGVFNSPAAQLPAIVSANSEPPYACVGLGTGTMASYCRPFQHMTFYEIDNTIRSFSEKKWPWPDDREPAPFFNYVQDARKRGARIEIIMGDARYSMAKERPQEGIPTPQREHYYRVIELDAFSSDAIPVHLITQEAIRLYFEKLRVSREYPVLDNKGEPVLDKNGKPMWKYSHGGVLMVHTSNRHVDLVRPVVDVAAAGIQKIDLRTGKPVLDAEGKPVMEALVWRVGKDGFDRREGTGDPSDRGRFGSEYVMLARDERDLPPDSEGEALVWYTPRASTYRVWTDDYSNLLGAFRW